MERLCLPENNFIYQGTTLFIFYNQLYASNKVLQNGGDEARKLRA